VDERQTLNVNPTRIIMEKWKIAVIVALLAALPIFGYFQNAQESATNNPAASPTPENTTPPEVLQKLVGQTPPTLDIPAKHWMNVAKPLDFATYKGKVVLLEFWRYECHHCQEAMPFVEQLSQSMKSQGLEVVGLQSPSNKSTIERNWPALKKELQAKGVKHPVGFDEGRKNFKKFNDVDVKYPTFIVIGRDGKIVYANHGFTPPLWEKLVDEIKKALAAK
jgi:thiol-disulfide isomerase/thioredoxin